MAYIGNSPANTGNYQIVDDISSSFNGSLTSFALTAGSVAITPAKSGQLLVGVNGVLQEPDDSGTNGFKVSGSNIVFSSAPASGDTFWSVYQGQNVDIGTPSDDVVDTVHIKDNAITADKIAAGAVVADIATGGITTAKIADDAVTQAKIADDAVGSPQIAAGGVDTTAIGTNAVTTAKIAGDAVTNTKIANGAISSSGKIANDVIDSQHYADGSIDTAHIGDDQVTAAKLANSINTDIATGVTANTTANAALPKAGGTMTGNLLVESSASANTIVRSKGTAADGYRHGFEAVNGHTGGETWSMFSTNNSDGNHGGGKFVIAKAAMGSASVGSLVINSAGKVSINNSATTGTNTDTSNTGSVTLDFDANQNFVLTLTGNVTLANPSTETIGQSGFITFIQDGTGSRTVGLGTDYETAGGAGLTLSSTASATDIVPYVVVASGRILLGTPQLAFA